MKSTFVFFILIFAFFQQNALAQIDTSEQNISDAKLILKDIQKENNFKKGSIDVRVGLIQLAANKAVSPLKLNSRDQMPFVQVGGDVSVYKKFGVVYDIQHAQNAMGQTGGPNTTSSFQRVYQLGAEYKYIMDQTNIKNFVTLKLAYYSMTNNFKLVNPQLLYATGESGILIGAERSIPATELLDLRGGFDIVFLNKIKSDSILVSDTKGNGLQFKADLLYNLSKTRRIGIGYVISAFFNKYEKSAFEARDRHTQTYKALSLTYSYLF